MVAQLVPVLERWWYVQNGFEEGVASGCASRRVARCRPGRARDESSSASQM